MPPITQPLPHWTWDDLEAALRQFDRIQTLDMLRSHLLDGLRAEADSATPMDLLAQVLSTAWVLGQVGVSATAPHPEAARSVS